MALKLKEFQLERFFAKYEFKAPYLMCCSDCEAFTVQEILDLEPGAESKFKAHWLGYTESKGSPELRKEISHLYSETGPEEILVHSGAEEAIFSFMHVALNPGDHVIVQFPCYQSLYEVVRANGCEISKWELQQGDNGWELDLDYLEQSIKGNTKAIVINSPHNPTGYLLSPGEFEAIIQIARKKNLLLFSDEVYKYLEYAERDRLPWACDVYENAVSLGVMSKSFGLPGLRIGWIATRNRDIFTAMAAFKDYTTICNSAPSEFLAGVALRNKKQVLERNLGIINSNLELLDDFFARYKPLFTWNRPKAGPIAFPKLNPERNVEEVCLDLLDKKGVLILPGNYYDFGDRYFRLGFGRKNLREVLGKFEEYIREQKKSVFHF